VTAPIIRFFRPISISTDFFESKSDIFQPNFTFVSTGTESKTP
jgi:hypothetical protein